uniref:Uncharacterized protein n=1 Tax=Arundo donax TaxID=35708 RepID=A0A0A9FP47_ARUDO
MNAFTADHQSIEYRILDIINSEIIFTSPLTTTTKPNRYTEPGADLALGMVVQLNTQSFFFGQSGFDSSQTSQKDYFPEQIASKQVRIHYQRKKSTLNCLLHASIRNLGFRTRCIKTGRGLTNRGKGREKRGRTDPFALAEAVPPPPEVASAAGWARFARPAVLVARREEKRTNGTREERV